MVQFPGHEQKAPSIALNCRSYNLLACADRAAFFF